MQQDDNGLLPVWAEINLESLKNNLAVICKPLKPGTKVMAVVKANAYGHGAVKVAGELERSGIDYFAVASVAEGVELRLSGIKGSILLLEMIGPEQLDLIFIYNLTPTIYSLELAELLAKKSDAVKRKLKIHLRIDTGIGGLGVARPEIQQLIFRLKRYKSLEIEGIYTHLTSDYRGDDVSVRNQTTLFGQIIEEIKNSGVTIPLIHVASSLAIFTEPELHFNMVRTGIALYGIPPAAGLEGLGLQAVMQLKSRIGCLKELEANAQIGTYHDLFTAARPMKYAVIPIGYADAFFLLTVRQGEVLIRGRRALIIGQARMNQILVDVTAIPDVAFGDEVVIIGEQGNQVITAQEATAAAGIAAMNCESVCLLSSRVTRTYIKETFGNFEKINLIKNTEIATGVQ